MSLNSVKNTGPWTWIPTLYLAEGIPYVFVMSVAVIMFKRLGISNADITLYTSWLYLPWVIKPLWSPLVDLCKTKRWWILTMQFLLGATLACVALTIQADNFFRYSLAFLWLLAFSSATHDIAADGFYMIALPAKQQAYFVGIRNTFYRLATIVGQGLLVMLAGYWEQHLGQAPVDGAGISPDTAIPHPVIAQAWTIAIAASALLFLLFALYHVIILPPSGEADRTLSGRHMVKEFLTTFFSFFQKAHIGTALAFMLLFRLAESQLVKLAAPFMLDARVNGGLGLTTSQVGFVYGAAGVGALTLGGIIGGMLVARNGLRHWLWPMAFAMNLPNLVYVYLSLTQPDSLVLIAACVVIEQLGYGLGFTAYIFYLILFSDGTHKTAHYALCTGIMALGMMLPGMFSGQIQEETNYSYFFIWVMLCTIPSFLSVRFLKMPEKQ